MRTRKLVILAAGAVAALAVSSLPAVAADSTTTFSLTGSTLTISVPAPTADIATGATGSTSISGQLGDVTVTDARGNLIADWKVEVSATDFTTGTATGPETVLNDDIGYSAGAAVSTSGVGVYAPGATPTLNETLPYVAATWDGSGNNTVSWNPTIEFKNLSSKVNGQYSGTITHSLTAVL